MSQELIVKSILDGWNTHIQRTDKLINELMDEQLEQEVAPGRNRGTYLVGHLAAVHDRMLPLLGLQERFYPALDTPFLTSPDRAVSEVPPAAKLRQNWKHVNETLATHFNTMQAAEWFQKHTTISEEDFAKEPHRNKLSVLVSRANHLAYHFGQMAFLKK